MKATAKGWKIEEKLLSRAKKFFPRRVQERRMQMQRTNRFFRKSVGATA